MADLLKVTADSKRYASLLGLKETTPVGIVADKVEETGRLYAAYRLRNELKAEETIVFQEELGQEYFTTQGAVYELAYNYLVSKKSNGKWWQLFAESSKRIALISTHAKSVNLYEHSLLEKFVLLFPGYQIIMAVES